MATKRIVITKDNGRDIIGSIDAAMEQLQEIKGRINAKGAHPLDVARYTEWAQGYLARVGRDLTKLFIEGTK